jgi:hypothetical protein
MVTSRILLDELEIYRLNLKVTKEETSQVRDVRIKLLGKSNFFQDMQNAFV